jgi:hypothetical protein
VQCKVLALLEAMVLTRDEDVDGGWLRSDHDNSVFSIQREGLSWPRPV